MSRADWIKLMIAQGLNVVQRFFNNLAFVSCVQVEELAACIGHAADIRGAQFKSCLVDCERAALRVPAQASLRSQPPASRTATGGGGVDEDSS